MKYTLTKFIFVAIILVIVLERIMDNIGAGQVCSLIPFLPALLPCSIWNVFVLIIVIGLGLDNFVLPRFIKNKDVKISVGEYHDSGFLQSKKVGIMVNNQSDYDILPKVKLVGDIRCTEYMGDGSEKSYSLKMNKDNRFINYETLIGIEDTNPIVLVQVENNVNISLQSHIPLLLNSSFSFGNSNSSTRRARWDFNFRIVGKIKNTKFDADTYSISIEAFTRPYGENSDCELFVQMGDVEKL